MGENGNASFPAFGLAVGCGFFSHRCAGYVVWRSLNITRSMCANCAPRKSAVECRQQQYVFLCGMVVLGVLAGVGGGCGFDDWWKLLFPTTTPPHPHPSFPLELTAERNQVLIGRWGWDVMFWGGKDYLVSAAVGGF